MIYNLEERKAILKSYRKKTGVSEYIVNTDKEAFLILPHSFLFDTNLTSQELRLLLIIISTHSGENGLAFHSQRHFSNKMNLSLRTVNRLISSLKDKDFLHVVECEGSTSLYLPISPMEKYPFLKEEFGVEVNGMQYTKAKSFRYFSGKSNFFQDDLRGVTDIDGVSGYDTDGVPISKTYDTDGVFRETLNIRKETDLGVAESLRSSAPLSIYKTNTETFEDQENWAKKTKESQTTNKGNCADRPRKPASQRSAVDCTNKETSSVVYDAMVKSAQAHEKRKVKNKMKMMSGATKPKIQPVVPKSSVTLYAHYVENYAEGFDKSFVRKASAKDLTRFKFMIEMHGYDKMEALIGYVLGEWHEVRKKVFRLRDKARPTVAMFQGENLVDELLSVMSDMNPIDVSDLKEKSEDDQWGF